VRRGAQTNDLRAELHWAVVAVMGDVAECDVNGHSGGAKLCVKREPNGALWSEQFTCPPRL
jgi:hypothetical protein